MSPHDGNARFLAQGAARFPMPEGELRPIERRKWILHHAQPGGTGAEIGVFRGHFAAMICATLSPRKLYLVDPWTKLGATFGWGQAYTAFDTLPTQLARDETRARMAGFPDVEAVLIEDRFPDCLPRMPDLLDFAYLDASHQCEQTLRELAALDSRMAADGVIFGDDWRPDPAHKHHGVFRAVQTFTARGNWQIIAAGPEGQWALRRR